jgi:hypothetical protein
VQRLKPIANAACSLNNRVPMTNNRRDEPPGRHFRSDRVILVRGRWYVTTRERLDVGPFGSREEAEDAARLLTEALNGVDDPDVAQAFIKEFSRRRGQNPTSE